MRQVVLDTETTGLEVEQGHRVIEIGCVELVNRRLTGRTFHHYLNPEREIDEAALKVHGITQAWLADKPRFADIAQDLLEFVRGAELIIHNAAFDLEFLEAELAGLPAKARLGMDSKLGEVCTVLDTLPLARTQFPGQRNSLDALCKRLGIDGSARELHGALLDAQLLAEVYLAITGGQTDLMLSGAPAAALPAPAKGAVRGGFKVIVADQAELAAHEARLQDIERISNGQCRWLH